MPFPACDLSLTAAKWKIISRLVPGKYPSLKELAKDLEVSDRTLNRLVSRLRDANAIFTVPVLDLMAIEGGIPADLVIFFSSPETRRQVEAKILAKIEDYMFYAGIWKKEGLYNLIIPNAAAATEMYEKVAKIEGVGLPAGRAGGCAHRSNGNLGGICPKTNCTHPGTEWWEELHELFLFPSHFWRL